MEEVELNPNKYAQCAGKIFKLDFKELNSGHAVATITMSLSNGKDHKTGEWRPSTFVDWKAWGDDARYISGLQKGDFISLKGHISHEEWQDKNTGSKRTKIVFKALKISLDPNNP